MEELVKLPEVVAVGEVGLDYNRNYSPPETQESVFEKQVSCKRVADAGARVVTHYFLAVRRNMRATDERSELRRAWKKRVQTALLRELWMECCKPKVRKNVLGR